MASVNSTMRQWHWHSRTLETSAHFRCCRAVPQHQRTALISPATVSLLYTHISLGLQNSPNGLFRTTGPGGNLQGDQVIETKETKARHPKKAAREMLRKAGYVCLQVLLLRKLLDSRAFSQHFWQNCIFWWKIAPFGEFLVRIIWFSRKTNTLTISWSIHFLIYFWSA